MSMSRKMSSWKTPVESRATHNQHHIKNKDACIPLVLWNEPPRVKVSALYVLELPVSQPSQNSSFVAHHEDIKLEVKMDDNVYTRTQMCVFAGTVDGAVVYWRFEQHTVAQINILMFPATEESRHPVVGLVSGIDEWGQSTLISATRDGALARWQLPNGACAEANASLAKELAPLLGLEMLCNRRFAIVVSEESRLMVMDTWRMQLLYCMNTAQEQIRRSIAVGELPMLRPKPLESTLIRVTSKSNRKTNHGGESVNQETDGMSARERMSPSRFSRAANMSDAKRIAAFVQSNVQTKQQAQQWDAVVLSLGAEGLVKCFLWQQPRGSSSGTSFGVAECSAVADATWGFRWVQRSSWVISWADQAEDITCSQSTSLKNGDNMNPQTALMSSIDNSYFPLSVKMSVDSILVLLVWKTKFVVLKRNWLCPLALRGDGQASSKSDCERFRQTIRSGSCRITPIEFVRQAASTYGSAHPALCNPSDESIYWENGEFLDDGNVVLWTNTGHVFQFMLAELSGDPGGKLFIFTKNKHQLVPRSDSKALYNIDKATYITSMDCCSCCPLAHKDKCLQRKPKMSMDLLTAQRQDPGYTCLMTGSSISGSTLQIVHMCHRGTLGHWTIPAVQVSSPTRISQNKSNIIVAKVPVAEQVCFHSLTDGFEAASAAALGRSTDKKLHDVPQYRCCLTHLMIGREEIQSSSTFEASRRAGMRCKRRQGLTNVVMDPTGRGVPVFSTSAGAIASRLASALTGRGRPSGVGDEFVQPETDGSEQKKSRHLSYRHLLDIPMIAKGFADGMLYIDLLSQEHTSRTAQGSPKDSATRLSCHSGQVTALANYCWGVENTPTSFCVVSSPSDTSQAHLATEKNPFYRSRFRGPSSKTKPKDSALSPHSGDCTCQRPLTIETLDGLEPKKASFSDTQSNQPSIKFMLFSGGTDGVLCVIELILYRSTTNDEANGLVRHEVNILQKFRNHRSAIQQISISPLKKDCVDGSDRDDWNAEYPDRLVATMGMDRKVVIYAPQYSRHNSPRQLGVRNAFMKCTDGRCSAEWISAWEFSEHADSICSLDWHLERGLVHVECNDRMVYVWSTDTGILERKVPYALVYGGGNVLDVSMTDGANDLGCSIIDNSTLYIGIAAVQVIEFGALRSAEQLKKNWTSHCVSQFQGNATAVNCFETSLQSSRSSIYATGSMELFMLSLLLSWGVTPAIDQLCNAVLGIEPAHVLYSCALQDSTSRALTIPLPWSTHAISPLTVADHSITVGTDCNSLVMPVVPAFARNWQHSSALSASIALGVVSFCMSCMDFKHSKVGNGSVSSVNKEEFQVLWSQLITQHSVVLPECVAQFREPALEELAAFGFDSCEYTQLAARTLLSGVIKRLPAAKRILLSAEYSAKLHWEMVRLETELGHSVFGTVSTVGNNGGANTSSQPRNINATGTGSNSASASFDVEAMTFSLVVERLGSLVLLTSMIGTYFPGEISPAGAREVCDILVFLLKAPERWVASVSAELLTKGLMLFRPYLVDLSSLIVQLLMVDMREKQRRAQSKETREVLSGPGGSLANFYEGGTGGCNAAMSLLVEVGAYESAFVLELLQQEMHNHERMPGFHQRILLYIMELVNAHYLLMYRHLPAFMDTVLVCLDPTKPDRRRRCLPLSTRCLHGFVRRFPMIDFHKDTQRLALGTMEAVIVIYDLRTATKWRVLNGHVSAVSAVCFQSDGQVLVSYAARDSSVRWWNSGNTGLFGGMLKMHQSCLKEHKLTALKASLNGSAPVATGGASAGLKQIIQTCRFHLLAHKDSNSSDDSSHSDQLKCILRLTREDASQVQFLL